MDTLYRVFKKAAEDHAAFEKCDRLLCELAQRVTGEPGAFALPLNGEVFKITRKHDGYMVSLREESDLIFSFAMLSILEGLHE